MISAMNVRSVTRSAVMIVASMGFLVIHQDRSTSRFANENKISAPKLFLSARCR
jgi:hypothetical protein